MKTNKVFKSVKLQDVLDMPEGKIKIRDPSEVFIKVKLYDVLNSHSADSWKNMCEKYGINQWCISEGWADEHSEVEITLEDAALYGLVDMDSF